MAKYCPILNRNVCYLECLECEEKVCKSTEQTDEKGGNLNGETCSDADVHGNG